MGPDALRKPYYSKGASPLSWAVAVIAPIVAIAVSAASVGESVLPFLVVSCVAGIVFGTHVFYYLSPNWAKVALAVVFFGGMAALSLSESRWLGGMPVGLFGSITGAILGAHLRYFTDHRHAGRPNRGAASLLVQWSNGRQEYEEREATAESLEEKISSLDGKTATIVSALRGPARMDFCGDARGAMVVFYNPDTTDEGHWSFLASPGVVGPSLDVVIGDLKGSYARRETTTLEPALVAARRFASAGDADSSLSWKTSPDVLDRRPLPM